MEILTQINLSMTRLVSWHQDLSDLLQMLGAAFSHHRALY